MRLTLGNLQTRASSWHVYPVFLSCRRGFDQGSSLDFKPLFECLARGNAEIHRLYVTGID